MPANPLNTWVFSVYSNDSKFLQFANPVFMNSSILQFFVKNCKNRGGVTVFRNKYSVGTDPSKVSRMHKITNIKTITIETLKAHLKDPIQLSIVRTWSTYCSILIIYFLIFLGT